MNKFLLSVSFLLMVAVSHSQNSKIKFGIQGGVNYSDFRGYEISSQVHSLYSEKPAFAFLGGINFEYRLKEKWSLKLDINYERKSQKADNYIEVSDDDGITGYDYTSRKNYDYLVLPIMVKYTFTEKNSYYVNGGPFVSYLLKSKLTNDAGEIGGADNDPVDTTDLNKKTDFGLSIGFGKTFDLNEKNAIFIEIRENLGLTNTSKNKVWGDGEVRTNSLNLIVGYSLN